MYNDVATNAVIISAKRTPIGKFRGALSKYKAHELGGIAIKGAVQAANLSDTDNIDEVLMGNVVSAGLGQNIARQCGVSAGLPTTVGASTINKVCGAGLKAVILAAQAIKANDGDLFVAGGVENMSQAPHIVNGRLNELKFGNVEMKDSLYVDGLLCPFEDWTMGQAAEFIAGEFEVSREAMDRYALSSHQKAITAIDTDKFKREIIPINVKSRDGQIIRLEQDESPRRDTTLKSLSELKPVFAANGTVTPGNAPGLNDAAVALVVSSEAKAIELGTKPLARIVGYAQKAVDPRYVFDAPSRLIPHLLDRVGWSLRDVDLIELNEAFAAQILANGYSMSGIGWDWNKLNVNGGAIALGHPLGATGARLLTTLIYALKDRRLRKGIAVLCLGGGEAVAMCVEAYKD